MATESEPPASYVFLSYASADRDRALHIANLLEAKGISVWIDRKSIAGGTSWSGEIVAGIKGSTVLVVLVSPSAVISPNVQQELQLGWGHRRPILPLLLSSAVLPSNVEYVLAGRQWIDVQDQPDDIWFPLVVRALAGWNLGQSASVSPLASPDTYPAQPDPRFPIPVPSSNLPVEITSFVGRDRELQEIRDLLKTTHLLTLTGTGGCGKTRLALKLGESVRDEYVDGVWLVELAPLADPALIPQAVAAAVSLRESVGRDLTTVLVDGLRPLSRGSVAGLSALTDRRDESRDSGNRR
jgi:hypothetical protein